MKLSSMQTSVQRRVLESGPSKERVSRAASPDESDNHMFTDTHHQTAGWGDRGAASKRSPSVYSPTVTPDPTSQPPMVGETNATSGTAP